MIIMTFYELHSILYQVKGGIVSPLLHSTITPPTSSRFMQKVHNYNADTIQYPGFCI